MDNNLKNIKHGVVDSKVEINEETSIKNIPEELLGSILAGKLNNAGFTTVGKLVEYVQSSGDLYDIFGLKDDSVSQIYSFLENTGLYKRAEIAKSDSNLADFRDIFKKSLFNKIKAILDLSGRKYIVSELVNLYVNRDSINKGVRECGMGTLGPDKLKTIRDFLKEHGLIEG